MNRRNMLIVLALGSFFYSSDAKEWARKNI